MIVVTAKELERALRQIERGEDPARIPIAKRLHAF